MRQGSCEYEVYVRDCWRVDKRRGQHFSVHYTKRKCQHPGTVAVGTILTGYRYYCRQHAKMLESQSRSEGKHV